MTSRTCGDPGELFIGEAAGEPLGTGDLESFRIGDAVGELVRIKESKKFLAPIRKCARVVSEKIKIQQF